MKSKWAMRPWIWLTIFGAVLVWAVAAGQGDAAGDAADGAVLMVIWLAVGGFLYFLPTIIASRRRVPNQGTVFVVNFFLGWTFIGWIVALAQAMKDPSSGPVTPALPVVPIAHRKCPWCAEDIRQEAIVCRYCSRDVASVPTA